jgi:NAD(P)-dependent dehydrogenase (short-subunit alcohol dehydrogenase family)
MKINQKMFVVTGGGNGIGRESVLHLLSRVASLAAVDINQKGLEETILIVTMTQAKSSTQQGSALEVPIKREQNPEVSIPSWRQAEMLQNRYIPSGRYRFAFPFAAGSTRSSRTGMGGGSPSR